MWHQMHYPLPALGSKRASYVPLPSFGAADSSSPSGRVTSNFTKPLPSLGPTCPSESRLAHLPLPGPIGLSQRGKPLGKRLAHPLLGSFVPLPSLVASGVAPKQPAKISSKRTAHPFYESSRPLPSSGLTGASQGHGVDNILVRQSDPLLWDNARYQSLEMIYPPKKMRLPNDVNEHVTPSEQRKIAHVIDEVFKGGHRDRLENLLSSAFAELPACKYSLANVTVALVAAARRSR